MPCWTLPPDHPGRLVDDLVEHGLDLANIYACYTEAPLRPVPTAPQTIPSAGASSTRRHQGFTHALTFAHHPHPPQPAGCRTGPGSSPLPAGLLLACRPRMEPEPLRLRPRASHPAVTRDARRGGDRLAHRPEYYTFDIGRTSKRCLPLVSCTVTSHITRRSLRVRGGPARVMRRPTPTSRPDPAGSAPRSATATGVRRPATPVRRHSDLRSARCRLHLRSASPVGAPGPSARPESQAGQALSRVHSPCRATGSSGCCKQPG